MYQPKSNACALMCSPLTHGQYEFVSRFQKYDHNVSAPTATAKTTTTATTTLSIQSDEIKNKFEFREKPASQCVSVDVRVCDMSFYEGHTYKSLYPIPSFTLEYTPVGIRMFCKHCSAHTHTHTYTLEYVQKCVLTSKNGERIGFIHSILCLTLPHRTFYYTYQFQENGINFLSSFRFDLIPLYPLLHHYISPFQYSNACILL